jgi:hypothetical protein
VAKKSASKKSASKKSASKKRSATRRAARPAKRAKPARRAAKSGTPPGIRLKDLRLQLEAVLRGLESGTVVSAAYRAESTDFARARMAEWISNIDQICADGGCGPDMVFPSPI